MDKAELEQMERDEQRRMEERENERRIEDAMIEHDRELGELRLKIAEAKGYAWHIWKTHNYDLMGNPNYDFRLKGDPEWRLLDVEPEDIDPCAKALIIRYAIGNWPRDIAAAWELVEEAQAEPHEQAFELIYAPAVMTRWCAQIGRYKARGATAPEAISRAYLAWQEAVRQEAQP
jgi:hypothetical protein